MCDKHAVERAFMVKRHVLKWHGILRTEIEQFKAVLIGNFNRHNQPTGKLTLPRCRDAQDQMFIELASAGKTDVLINGDRNLLLMADACPFDIETPADFQRRMYP
ncbi:MAG: PIN domain-containing protein [Mariprofundaceae bacterium]|nr:PIN domain-containing protein [Mariprofundaceae bacterium]